MRHTSLSAAALLFVLGACDRTVPTELVECSAATATPVELTPHEGRVLPAPGACLQIPGSGARYIVIPQLASAASSPLAVDYVLGAPGSVIATSQQARTWDRAPVQHVFDAALRRAEAALPRPSDPVGAFDALAADPPPLHSTRSFRVLSTLDPQNPAFESVTGSLRYAGEHILIYVDEDAPPPPQGFTDERIAELGAHFDQDLHPLGTGVFGNVSDIDGNGRVIVLFTPVVNALSDAATCQTVGFVSGFFFGFDLSGTGPNSNRAEIYYSSVPDPEGTVSCPLPATAIERVAPATFIHELQHMISYNHHVLQRRGAAEVLWLNEGLSHVAEELASRLYEERYPAPSGRTDPLQLFPDSSQGFIAGNLMNAYRYLRTPSQSSVTSMTGAGGLAERGASWLFLRWLADQKGDAIFRALVQTNRTGIANVEAVAGEAFESLFGDFSVAVWADSIPGAARTLVPSRYRYHSRNLRELFNALYESRNSAMPDPQVPTPFPVAPRQLDPASRWVDAMPRGTMDFFILDLPDATSSALLEFASPGGSRLPSELRAQVGVFRLR